MGSVSPHHVVISRKSAGELKCTLVDFRSALSANDGQMGQMQHGKMPYMAPEMMAGLPHHPLRVDCWSLGAVLLECAAGHEALAEALQWNGQAEPCEETAEAVRESLTEIGLPARLAAEVGVTPSSRCLRAIDALLRPDPAERRELRETLDDFLESGDVQPSPGSPTREDREDSPDLGERSPLHPASTATSPDANTNNWT